jgi:hypothetical protein
MRAVSPLLGSTQQQDGDMGDSVSLPDYGDSVSLPDNDDSVDSVSLERQCSSDRANYHESVSRERQARSDTDNHDNSVSRSHSDNIVQASTDNVLDKGPSKALMEEDYKLDTKSSMLQGPGFFPLHAALLAKSPQNTSESQLAG